MRRNLIDFKSSVEGFLNDTLSFILEGEEIEIITDILLTSKTSVKSVFNTTLEKNLRSTAPEEIIKAIQDSKPNYEIWLFKTNLPVKSSYLVVMVGKEMIQKYSSSQNLPFKSFLPYFIEKSILFAISNSDNLASLPIVDKDEFVRKVAKEHLKEIFGSMGIGYLVEEAFTVFSIVSTQKYEKERSEGFIIFPQTRDIPISVEFSKGIDIARRNYRVIRKVLEFSKNPNFSLVAYDGKIVGISDTNLIHTKSLLIRFYENTWEVCMYDPSLIIKSKNIFTLDIGNMRFLPLIRIKNGLPEIPEIKFDRDYLRETLTSTFKNIPKESLRKLTEIVSASSRLGHGLIIIITTSNIARMEASRLTYKSFQIKPFSLFENDELNIELLRSITSIDGAIIIDLDGICYGIGIILDGDISGIENPSRGARYNSPLRYIETRNNEAVAIVVSDDGMVDIISTKLIQEKKIIGISEMFIEEKRSLIS
jgi:hypothetical protein